MASNKVILCRPCQEGKDKTKADIWCYNCDEGLCSTCLSHHKRSKASCDHKTIDIKSYKPSIGAIKTECDKHGKQLNLYCPSHLMPCCDQCISTSHSKCTRIKSLASVVDNTKIEKSTKKIDNDINSTLHILNEIKNNKSGNIKRGEEQVNSMNETIAKYRKKINKHLDDLEKKLCQETDTILNQEKSKASAFITEIDGKQKSLKKMQNHLHNVTTHSSKLHSFLEVHQIEQQVHQCQQYVQNLENDERTKEFDIQMNQNDDLEKILRNLKSSKSLGEVTVVKTDVDWNVDSGMKRGAQVESQEQTNINNMTMNIETKIEININKGISDMICLMDGRFIVVEQLGNVNLFSSNGKLQKQLPIPGGAWSVTQINQKTIAITYPNEKAIKIFSMENETGTEVITLDKSCWGLSFYNNSLAVGLNDDEIRIIYLEGNTRKSIKVQCASDLENLVYCNDRVINIDYSGRSAYCYDGSCKQIWHNTQHLLGPQGLCLDTYGNIIVADQGSNRIIVLSKDGQNSKVLIGKEDGLEYPKCICFKHNESAGFICDWRGTYLSKFNLSSG